MTAYGYKLFEIRLFQENGRKAQPFTIAADPVKKLSGRNAAEHVESSLVANRGRKCLNLPHSGSPEDDVEEIKTTDPVYRVERLERTGQSVAFVVRDGRNDGFDTAVSMDSDAADLELTGWAPSREYRGVLTLPTDGDIGLLVLECIGKRCPVVPFIRWLKRWSQDLGGSTGDTWWRLTALQVADDQQLRQLVANGEIEEVVLRNAETAAAGGRDREEYRLTAKIRDGSLTTAARAVLEGWLRRFREKPDEPSTPLSDELRPLVGADVESIDFNDGYIRVRDSNGPKNLNPDRMSEMFIYNIDRDERPGGNVFYASARSTVVRMGMPERRGLNLDEWPTDDIGSGDGSA